MLKYWKKPTNNRWLCIIHFIYLSTLEISSDNFVNSSSVPLNIPGGIFPLSVPFLAMSATSSGVNPVPTKEGCSPPSS